jgi:hypothetical protein
MIRVYGAANLQDAHIVRGLLQQAGIDATVLNEHAQGGLGDIPFGEAYPQVWVADERDVQRALAVIGDYQKAPVRAGAVFCRVCGEECPANFDVCWNCGASLSGEASA